MTVDFGKLLEAQQIRDDYAGPLELDVAPFDLEATFDVRRGSFRLPLALKKKPEAWARAFAQATPDDAIVTSTRDGDDEVFRWRVVRADIHAA